MKHKQLGFILILSLLGGFIGGAFAGFLLATQPALAQKIEPVPVTFPELMRPKTDKVIRAERFELVDSEGRIRATLEIGPDFVEEMVGSMMEDLLTTNEEQQAPFDHPQLTFSDPDGTILARFGLGGFYLFERGEGRLPRVQIDLQPDGTPRLGLQAEDFRAELTRSPAGVAGLAIYDNDRIPRFGFGLSSDGRPGLALSGQDGMVRASIGLFPRERPGIYFTDPKGMVRASYGLSDAGLPGLAIYDREGKERALLSLGAEKGEPALAFYDESAHILALFGSTELEQTHTASIPPRLIPSLVLYDKDLKAIWSAP